MSEPDSSKVTCQACKRVFRWREELASRRVRCQCGETFMMPAAAPAEAAPGAADDRGCARPEADGTTMCSSCHAPVRPGAVICISCGYNLREGTQLKTETGGMVRPTTGPQGTPRRVTAPDPEGFAGRLSRGWALAKISYGILWDFKQLTLFPVFSALASILIAASFILPLWGTGTLQQLSAYLDKHGQNHVNPGIYALAFAFYFCCYFVVVFFNTALTACAMKVTAGEAPTLKYGLSVAIKRLPQILAWALVSAVIGVLLKAIENSHKKAGRFVGAILGAGWTIITYFVVPVLAVEGIGPFAAIKRSTVTLRDTWGEGLVGNAAMGLISFLIGLALMVIIIGGVIGANALGNSTLLILILVVGLAAILLWSAVSSAADGVLKALLYNYATGRSMPADIDQNAFVGAFASKGIAG